MFASCRDDSAFPTAWLRESTDRPGSDIDVLVIGDPDRVALSDRLAPIEQDTGREVNTTVLSRDEFERLRKAGSGFVTEVLAHPLIALVGGLGGHEGGG